MSDDKGFRKMSELVEALRSAELGLQNGALSISELEAACGDARELYERLVVLRHKARESRQTKEPPKQATPPAPAVNEPAPTVEEQAPEVPVHETPAQPAVIRLETRPAETRQTSLIEAIADTEKEVPTPAQPSASTPKETPPAGPKPAASLAEKMEKAHIDDLGKAISLSHKFWFTAELFNGDRTAFEQAVTQINAASDLETANTFFRTNVLANLKKPADPEANAAFMELIQRRFA